MSDDDDDIVDFVINDGDVMSHMTMSSMTMLHYLSVSKRSSASTQRLSAVTAALSYDADATEDDEEEDEEDEEEEEEDEVSHGGAILGQILD